MSGDWFDTGYNGIEEADKEYESRYDNDLKRFYLKAKGETWETEKEIVFETDEPICIWEHQLFLNGNWFNWFTCRKALEGGCYVCNSVKDKPTYVGFYLVRDMTGFKSKKTGQMVGVGRRVLFPAKRQTLKQLQKFKERRGTLVGKKFFVSRSTDNSPNCGDAFDYIEDVELGSLPDPGGEKPDLIELFRPKTNEELKNSLGGGSKEVLEEDDVPF